VHRGINENPRVKRSSFFRGTNEDHAVASVRYEGRWLILDNRNLDIRQDVDSQNVGCGTKLHIAAPANTYPRKLS
jgi:hypothetical protein